jgi:hypothetical protein
VSAPGFPENPPFVEGGLTFYPAVLANCTDQIRKRSACVDSRSLDGTIVRVFTPALYADPFYRG